MAGRLEDIVRSVVDTQKFSDQQQLRGYDGKFQVKFAGRQVKARTVEANRIFSDGLRPGRRAGPWNAGERTYHSVERSTGRSLAAN